MRAFDHSLRVKDVEFFDCNPEPLRLSADLVQRGQWVVAIKGRVLYSLRHDRPGQLLEAQDEIAPRFALLFSQSGGVSKEQELADEIEDRRAGGGVAPF